MSGKPKSVSVAITGASGIRVALRLLEVLSSISIELKGVIITEGGLEVALHEEGITKNRMLDILSNYAKVYMEDDFRSPLASSSNQPDAMIIVPASMKTIASIAYGMQHNLVTRAALAILRLGRKLVVAPRETPLGLAELENLLRVAKLGALIVPLCPGFYHRPQSLSDIVDFLVGKILDVLGIQHNLYRRWGY